MKKYWLYWLTMTLLELEKLEITLEYSFTFVSIYSMETSLCYTNQNYIEKLNAQSGTAK